MKKLTLAIGLAALVLAACGKKEESAPPAGETPPAAGAPAPAPTEPAESTQPTTEEQK